MDTHGNGPESAELDFATIRLQELDEFFCQPSQSNPSSETRETVPYPDLLNQSDEISSLHQIDPIGLDNRFTTSPLVVEAPAPRSLDSESISDQAREQHPLPIALLNEEQHLLPPKSPVSSNSQSEHRKISQQPANPRVKSEHNNTHSPASSISNQTTPPCPIRGSIQPKESNQSPRSERSCDICGSLKYCKRTRGGTLCHNCYKYCSTKRTIEPCRESGNCSVVWKPRVKLCSSCRMRKAMDLGFVEEDRRTGPNLVDFGQEELDEDIQMQLAIQASLEQGGEQWEDYSCLIEDNAEEEDAETPRTIESRSDEMEHPAGGVYIEVTEEEPLPPIEQGLPDNVSHRFSRWWWNDLEGFKKGGMVVKKPEDEVLPPKLVKIVRTCNNISEPKLDFVTQDIDVEEPEPFVEIFTPIMQLLPNASLARGREPAESGKPIKAGDAVVARAKPRLTLKLETHRTIIDRRPMLKKLKTGAAPRNQNESNMVSTTSLIAPGEDCDDSEDDEILEIDCGNT